MRANKKLAKKLNSRFAEKQDELDRRPAVMGDGAGNLYVTGFDNFVYVTMGDKAVPVFNNRVPPQTGLQVWVGYAAEEPTLFQVLATRSESPAGTQTGFVGYAPARRYEWMARNGGQDPLSVHLRAFTPLKLSVSPDGWMFVDLYRGFIYSGSAYIAVPRQNVDLYAQIPTTTGKAAFVLITINTSGTVVQTKGSEVNIEDLAITDIPTAPANTAFVCGAVRVYYGQLEIQEGRTNTDFVDLRFPGYAGGGLWQPLDSDLTAIAALSPVNDDIIQRKAGAWTNRTLAQYKADIHLNNINVDTMMTDSKDPTGWVDPSAITVSYDSAARTITLTGTLEYYWRGVKTTLTSPWTSSAHTATNGGWFLSSTDGTNFTWSLTAWTFDVLMVAFVNYGATYKFALRETHGLMQWQTHEELHTTIGTFKESGGTLSNYTLLSTTAANRRPDVAATHLHDEDNETTNAALTSKLYNKLYLAGSTPTITYTGETADIVPLLVNNPYYNSYSAPNWGQTLMSNNSYMCVWLVAIPTAADTTSQTYRYTWVQGQSNGNLASQTALTPSDLNLAAFATEATEFVFLAKVIIRYTGGNWDLYSVTTLTGNRMLQVGSPAGAYLSSVAVDATLTGDGSLASPLTVVQSYVTLTGDQTVAGIKTFTSAPVIAPATPTDGTDLMKFTTERAWTLQQASTGGTAMLEFFSDTAGKYVRINPNSNTAGGLIVADSMPTGTLERLMVEGTGDIKAQVSTLSTTGYAFFRLKNDAASVANFGFFGSARAGTLFGINQAGLFAMYGSVPMVVGTSDTNILTLGNNNAARVSVGALVTNQVAVNYAADAQASDTYVITLAPALLAYSAGLEINFKANTANTGAATINVNGLGAKTIVKAVSTALADNDILAGMFCKLIYDGTNFVLLNPRAL